MFTKIPSSSSPLFCTFFIFSSLILLIFLPNNTISIFINTKFIITTAPPTPTLQQQPPPHHLHPPPPKKDDDEELFKLASKVSLNPSLHPNTPKKLAFMFLTTTPLSLDPLWEAYFLHNQNNITNTNISNLFNIYIHADPSFSYNPPFSGLFANRLIPSKPTRRGSPSLISAARRLISHALLDDPANSFFILLSSSCIPIHSFNFTYTTLITSNPYNMSYIDLIQAQPSVYSRYLARGARVMLPEIPFEKFRFGSQFFILSRKHAKLAVGDKLIWSKFKHPCLKPKTCYPEEHYFSTLLSLQDPEGCIPATLTHVDWSKRLGSHPYMYNKTEVTPILFKWLKRRKVRFGNGGVPHNISNDHGMTRNRSFLFARKFSSECIEPLMSIAHDVIFRK